MNLNPTTSALTCGTTDLEDIYHVTPEMEKFGENKLEIEIEDIDISPIFDVFECLGDDEFHEECLELPGYIIKFEEAPIYSFSHYDKPIFSEIRGIKLKRNGVRLRQNFPLLVSKTWDWDSFPWDPGGFVRVRQKTLNQALGGRQPTNC